MRFAGTLRQFLAFFFVFMLSAEVPGQVFHLTEHLLRPEAGGAEGLLEHLIMLAAYCATLVCALFFSQKELGRQSLLRSYPPQESVPLAMHCLGLVVGLVAVFRSGSWC